MKRKLTEAAAWLAVAGDLRSDRRRVPIVKVSIARLGTRRRITVDTELRMHARWKDFVSDTSFVESRDPLAEKVLQALWLAHEAAEALHAGRE